MPTVLNTANTQANISSNIYTNGNNLVTAAMVASVLQNISVSYINRITDYNLLGLKVFSTTTQYQIGDCVVYSGQLYQCTTAHLGSWSAGDFALVGGGGTGTVVSVSGVAVNGFTWSIANASTTPAITLTLQNASTSQSGQLTNTDWNTFNGKQAALNGTGFVKASGTTISYDNSTYLTSIAGIGAGGDLGGLYPSPYVRGILGVTFPTLPTSGSYQLQASITSGSVTAWSFVAPLTSLAISSLTAATASNTFDNANYAQTWTWNSLAGSNIGLSLTSSSGASNGGTTIFNVAQTGTISNSNQTVLAAKIYNTATNSQINVALQCEATGGATGNAAIYVPTSAIGLGTSNPGYGLGYDTRLHIYGTGTGTGGRTQLFMKNGSSNSAAVIQLQNAGGKSLFLQAAGSTYTGGEYAFMLALGNGGTYNYLIGTDNSSSSVYLQTNSTNRVQIDGSGNISMVNAYIGAVGTSATAYLHIAASTTSKASLRIVGGTAPTSPNDGDIWYTGSALLQRVGSTSKSIWVGNDAASAPATTVLTAFTNYYGTGGTIALSTPNSWASVVVNGTTYKIPLYT